MCQAAPSRGGLDVALMFVVNDEVTKTDELDGSNPFVSAVKKVVDANVDVLGKHL